MTHPYVLHATAALWSLRRSWPQLLAAQQAATAAMADDGDRGTLQAWRPGSGRHSGHSDGMGAVLACRTSAVVGYFDQLADRVRGHVEQARWLAVSNLRRPVAGLPLFAQLATAIPHVDPLTARDIAAELATADSSIRRTLRLPPNHWPLPGAPACPCCGIRMLRAQTAAPDSKVWSVVCTAGCRCEGEGCSCGMPIKVRGVAHIWEASSPLIQAVFEPAEKALVATS